VFELLAFAATIAATAFGYVTARKYVRDRLKFVDAVQTLKAPIVAGLVAWAVAMPLTWLLPFVSIALGVRAGARDIRVARRITAGEPSLSRPSRAATTETANLAISRGSCRYGAVALQAAAL
jgi:hypothetical protein